MLVRRVRVRAVFDCPDIIAYRYGAAAANFSRTNAVLSAVAPSGSNFGDSIFDGYIAAAAVLSSADACSMLAAFCSKCTSALDGQRMAFRDIDSGKIMMKAINLISALKNECCISLKIQPYIQAAVPVLAVNGYIT